MKCVLFIAAVVMSAPAPAQTTNCYAVGKTMQCDTYQTRIPASPPPSTQQGYSALLGTLQQSGHIYDRAQERAARQRMLEQQMEINRLKAEQLKREANGEGK